MKKNLIAQITKAVTGIKACQFASLVYLSKKHNELSRFTVNLGFSYHNLVEKSVTELELLIAENSATWTALQKEAAEAVMASLKKTLAAHAVGEQNADYTKKGQYIPIGNGVNLNTSDNTIQLFGLVNSKVVLVPGVYPTVNSKPLTIEKNKITKQLSISKFREFALDLSQVAAVKVNGQTLEMEPVSDVAGYSFTVNPAAPVAAAVAQAVSV
jgi:hypothetical protein